MPAELSKKFVGDLDWNLLRTFAVIVKERGITAAANRLLRRQPTVSLALQAAGDQARHPAGRTRRRRVPADRGGAELYRECLDIHANIARLPDMAGRPRAR